MYRKLLSIFVTAALLTTNSFLPVFAAAREDNKATCGVDKSKGYISETSNDTGIQVTTDAVGSEEPQEASFSISENVEVNYSGNVTSDGMTGDRSTCGVRDQAVTANATAVVGKSVNVEYGGSDSDVNAVGVNAYAVNGEAKVEVKGSVSSHNKIGDAYGVIGISSSDPASSVDISVNGSVNAASDQGDAVGVDAENRYRASISIETGGDVYSKAKNEAYGISVNMEGQNAKTLIDIGGSVTAKGNSQSAGMIFRYAEPSPTPEPASMPSTDASVRVKGDVNSNGKGIIVEDVKNGSVDVVIEGTLSTDGPAVVIDKDAADDFTLTAWRIDAPDLVMEENADGVPVHTSVAQAEEKNIQYIVKVEPKQANSITLKNTKIIKYTDADGRVTSYDTAHEGERVAVKLSIPDGYSLYGVYSDEGQRKPLNMDRDGNYYLVVPRGGGIMVSMTLVKDEPEPVPTRTRTPTPFNTEDGAQGIAPNYLYNLSDIIAQQKDSLSDEELYNAFMFAEQYAEYNCPEYLTGEKRQAFIEYFMLFFRNMLTNYHGESMKELEERATDAAELAVRTMD